MTCASASAMNLSERVPETAPILGIDLGTTYCCTAVYQDGQVKVIPNTAVVSGTTPSYVTFEEDGEHTVGQEAKDNAFLNSKNTVFAIKRVLGRRFNEPEVQRLSKTWPFKMVDNNGFAAVEVELGKVRQTVAPEDVSAALLSHLKSTAERFIGKPITKAVITVPASFYDSQMKATKLAGEKAGLEVIALINEPTAAAIAYGLQNRASNDDTKTILVFDFGGGTLDVSIIRAKNKLSFQVVSTVGDMEFGGEDFDERLLKMLVFEFEQINGPGLSGNQSALSRLRGQAEFAKRTLSAATQTKISINSLHNLKNFQFTVTRDKFEIECANLFPKILVPVREALEGAKLTKSDIHQVILVGGSSRIPRVITILQEFFSVQQIFRDINPDEAIAQGAAIYAHTLAGQASDIVLENVIPRTLGVELYDGSLLTVLPRFSRIPSTATQYTENAVDFGVRSSFPIYEGENIVATKNRLWATLVLKHPVPKRKGELKSEITFNYDTSGMLYVVVKEEGSGATVDMQIKVV